MKHTNHYNLTPIVAAWVKDLTAHRKLLDKAIIQYESPLNIHCKDNFEANIKSYSSLLSSYDLPHKIYFARKANKCLVFPWTSHQMKQGIDTASYREVAQCLEAGIPPDRIVCTAAVKNRKLLELLVESDIEIVLDNADEIDLLDEVCRHLDKEASVIIRLCGFTKEQQILPSRFGFPLNEAYSLIADRIGKVGKLPFFKYKGLHFHLNGYDYSERAIALHQSCELIERLNNVDIKTYSIDMGGGLLMNYLSDEQEWLNFHEALKQALMGEIPAITYGNDGLGLIVDQNRIIGNMNVYPYFNKINKESLLKKILNVQFKGRFLHEIIRGLDVELRMEPGRSLLDQCGVTVAKVAFRKRDTADNLLIGLEMNRTQLRSSSADFLSDPIHLKKDIKEDEKQEAYGYLVGSYCLEQEHILKRKIRFEHMPQIGDLFVFVNTAGYMMHFYESEAHLFPLAKNLIYNTNSQHLSED